MPSKQDHSTTLITTSKNQTAISTPITHPYPKKTKLTARVREKETHTLFTSPTFLTPLIIFKLNKPMSYKLIMGKGSFYLSLSQPVHFLRQNCNTQRFAFKFLFHVFFYGFAPTMLGEDFQLSFPRTVVFNFNSL